MNIVVFLFREIIHLHDLRISIISNMDSKFIGHFLEDLME